MPGSSFFATGEFPIRYVVDRELGAGATSNVFLARDTQAQCLVAIKVLRRELAESLSAERFLREIRLTARLRHKHIAPILDAGEVGGRPFCVLPYMEGGTLRARLDRNKQLPIDDALAIGAVIARALEFAHSQSIIHRDVKPENILFSGGDACLADFGIARAIEGAAADHSTSTGVVRGTPAYMSPEQASGDREYDGRTDIYSLGCVLYEMIAGVPVFTGPTSQSVLAQRLSHMPRPIRVYRPTAPLSVQQILERALATSPADRFQSAGELALALDSARARVTAGTADVDDETGRTTRRLTTRRAIVFAGVVVAIALSYAAYQGGSSRFTRSAPLDSTQIAIFSLDNDSAAGPSNDLLRAGLKRWQGLSIIPNSETGEAVRRRHVTSSSSSGEWRSAATDLHAGRFIVTRIIRTPTGRAVAAEYRDVAAGLLHGVELPLPADSSRVAEVYRAIADSLLLRGATDGGTTPATDRSRSLFATQAFIAGMSAESEWNLVRADSMFARAAEIDPAFTRAHLWLAQVRLWRAERMPLWASSVDRAAADTNALVPVERTMTGALAALVRGDFGRACDRYRSLIAADSANFIGWYGLGDCTARDYVVVRDSRSPSGWRYRSSYYRAITAYARAFELLPATFHGFQAGGYERLRELLYTSSRALRRGVSGDPGGPVFVARARLIGDTIAMIPFEQSRMVSSDPLVVQSPEAVELLRSLFHRIAMRWTSAFPKSAEAKEAIAISLELRGDRAALDSMRAAQRLATDPLQRLRYAAASVVLQVKFNIPDGIPQLVAARREADSLLVAHPTPSGAEATMLASVAAIAGRCAATANLVRPAAASGTVLQTQIPQDLAADAYELRARLALGCPVPDSGLRANRLMTRIDEALTSDESRRGVEYYLLAPAVPLDGSPDSAVVFRLAPSGDPLLRATASAIARDTANLRVLLAGIAASRRNSMLGDFTPDAALPEARLLLHLKDTAAASRVLEMSLAGARGYAPLGDDTPYNVSLIGSLVGAMELRARLGGRSDGSAARWSRATLALWDRSEALQPARARGLASLAVR